MPSGPSRSTRRRRGNKPRTPADNVRATAGWVVEQTLSTFAPSTAFLESGLARCDPHDHGLLRELSLGTLRWLRRIDAVIAQASHRPFDSIDPGLRNPLRIAAYQLLFLDRIPPHAAVHEGVEQARRSTHRGGASFANAVLRKIARHRALEAWPVEESDPVRRLAIETSHPDLLVERWLHAHGRERTEALLAANNRAKALSLLCFRDRGGREMVAESLIDEGVEVEPSRLSSFGLLVRRGNPLHSAAFERGEFYVQDEASQAAAVVPPLRPGERVADLAASPGGKSLAMLAHDPDLDLVVADVDPGRLPRLRENLARLGRARPVVLADAGSPGLAAGSFDRVVLDLPCTGTGTLRKHPELKWRLSTDEMARLSRQARRLAAGAGGLVRDGGRLVLITCSLEPDENERVAEDLVSDGWRFVPLEDEDLPRGLEPWVEGPGRVRIFPEADHDGFTVQVLERARARV